MGWISHFLCFAMVSSSRVYWEAMRSWRRAVAVLKQPNVDGGFGRIALVGAAGAAALVAVPGPLHCYYDPRQVGDVDRLKRWSSRNWNIKAGASPGFHLRVVNPWLERHQDRLTQGLDLPEGSAPSILIPLCGKSMDLPYLAEQGFRVCGIEGVTRPILELRQEHRVRVKEFKNRTVMSLKDGAWTESVGFIPAEEFQGKKVDYAFKNDAQGLGYYADLPAVWRGKVRAGRGNSLPFHILQSDVFSVTPELIKAGTFEDRGAFDIVYDRGGLDVVPPDNRQQYVETLSPLVRDGGRVLLVAMQYDQAQVPIDPTGKRWSPPPFSVPEEEVRRLFPEPEWHVEVLGQEVEKAITVANPSFQGVTVTEVCYLITKKGTSAGSTGSRKMLLGGALLGLGAVGAAVALSKSG